MGIGSIRGSWAVAGLIAALASCASAPIGTRVQAGTAGDPARGFVAASVGLAPDSPGFSLPTLTLVNAYDPASDLDVLPSKGPDGTLEIYSVVPGKYFLRAGVVENAGVPFLERADFIPLPYHLQFVFEVKPGQIVYLGDYRLGKQSRILYEPAAAQSRMGSLFSDLGSLEWVSLERPLPKGTS